MPEPTGADDAMLRSAEPDVEHVSREPVAQRPTVDNHTDMTVDLPAVVDASAPTVDQLRDEDTAQSGQRPASGSAVTPESRKTPRSSSPETVAGYEILGLLGRGAMGVVYKARQPGLNRLVALKMILAGGHASERDIARFLTEAEAVAQLQHPNVVQIYEVGEDNGKPYFSLEYVDGQSLSRLIDGKPQPPRQAAQFALQLAQGMAAAHAKGIIHRDLKPANVLVSKDGVAKITDFGLAKKLDHESGQTHAGTVLGTPSYMSPEQAQGQSADVGPLADIYSLGAILYEMLTGRPPFQGASVLETLEMVKNQDPVAPTQFQAKAPRDLETICLKCLNKDASRRYASASDLADDLERYLKGHPILARPVGSVERLLRWSRRNPRVAVLSAAMIVLMIVWAATSSALAIIANENKKAADENKREAETQRDKAVANALQADINAEAARNRSEHVFEKMIQLGEAMQDKLRSRRLSERLGPEAKQLQQAMMTVLRDKMLDLSRELTEKNIRNFGQAATYQKLGDLLKRLGQGVEAARLYDRGFQLVKQVSDKEPANDLAHANMGVMLMRLGDVALELNGDAKTARGYYQRGWKLQRQIADHPRSNVFTADKNTILLSHHAVRIGKADLALGHAADAAKQFATALAYRKRWVSAMSNSPEARSYLAEAYLLAGVAAWQGGDMDKGIAHIRECVERCEALAKEHPGYVPFEADVADCSGQLGDVLLRGGKSDAATKAYRRAQQMMDAVLTARPDDPQWQPLLALQYERLGGDARQHGRQDEAARHFAQALKIREDLVLLEPNNRIWQAAYIVALARAGKRSEALQQAKALESKVQGSAELLLQLAHCHALCAAAATTPAEKETQAKAALSLLKATADMGYRDGTVWRTDPDLIALRKLAAFTALIDKIS